MQKYNVYKHPILGYEAIKQGFSWPGFLFTWIWAFVKKLWIIAVVLLFAAFIANGIGFSLAENGTVGAFFGLIATFIPMAIAGVKGNEWREKSMLTRGYEHECTVMAESSDGALAEAMKPTEERQRISKKWDNTDIKKNDNNYSKKSDMKCESCGGFTRLNFGTSNRVLCAKCKVEDLR